jgi:hypothetical protein
VAVIDFTIERVGYDTILLNSDGGGPYGLLAGSQGFGVGPVVPRFRESSGDGGQYVGDKVGAKSIDLGVLILGADRLNTGELIRSLRNLLRWREGEPFARLVASYANGVVLEVPVVYASGLEHDYSGALPTTFRATVAVTAANPFWVARDAQMFAVTATAGDTEPFLDDMSGLPVASSNAIGNLLLTNDGDVGADLTVIIVGPSSGATTVLVNGEGYIFEDALAGGETITVKRSILGITVTDNLGVNRYASLGNAPLFPQLRSGVNQVAITMVGATSDSRISGNFQPRFEGVY